MARAVAYSDGGLGQGPFWIALKGWAKNRWPEEARVESEPSPLRCREDRGQVDATATTTTPKSDLQTSGPLDPKSCQRALRCVRELRAPGRVEGRKAR